MSKSLVGSSKTKILAGWVNSLANSKRLRSPPERDFTGDWARCGSALAGFALELRAHLAAEEAVLFPAFEAASGMKNGPTQMMRIEHEQMRELLGQLEAGLAAQDAEGFDGAAETLLILMQQHNMKEENILYPMCDRALAGDVGRVTDTLLTQLREAGCQLPR